MKWNFHKFNAYLKTQNVNVPNLWVAIKDIVVKTIISVEGLMLKGSEIFKSKNTKYYELLGFDILLDTEYKPWLIEVN